MLLLRPTTCRRYRGYICPSCTAKLQVPGRPPWLTRNATTQAGHQGSEKGPRRPARQAVQQAPDSVKIRYFDDVPGGPLDLAPEDEMNENTIEDLKARIAALEADMKKIHGIDLNPGGKSLIDEAFLGNDTDAQRRALKALSLDEFLPENLEDPTSEDPKSEDLTSEGITIPVDLFPEDRRKGISKLNQALENFAKQPSNPTYVRDLWRLYSHSRQNLSSAWHLVPSGIWMLLWDAFSWVGADNPNRTAHIKKLGEDIRAAGVNLSRNQILLYIESLLVEGSCARAIGEWEAAQIALTYDPSTACQYWALGVRMLAQDKQPERAEQATDSLIMALSDGGDPRALIPVIRSWLDSGGGGATQRAWAVYIRLKHLLASEMQMSDYDAISGAFLAAQQTDLALGIFKDMMLSNDISAQNYDSITLYKRAFPMLKDLRSFRLTQAEKSWTSPEPFIALPKKQHNKYFYGSWIKKLIGDGEADWAAQVARLAYRHDIIPDPRHMNGIIGAWLRSGTVANQQSAEDLAWKMVARRLDYVRARDQFVLGQPVRAVVSLDRKGFSRPSLFSQISTLATVETFCILINYYQRRRRGDRVEEVCTAIRAAKIKPNTSFLNDLLLVGATSNRKHWAWSAYQKLVREDDVGPDQDTFTILWQMMKDHVKGNSGGEFPSPRELFSEMVKWPPSKKQGVLSREAYELVLDCFGLANDEPGVVIALRAMQRLFDLYPDEETVRNILFHLAQIGTQKITHRFRAHRARDLKSRVSKLTDAFKKFEQRRTQDLADQGINVDEMDETSRAEELLCILTNVLNLAATSKITHPSHNLSNERAEVDSERTREILEDAADEMGMPQFVPILSGFPTP